jgi:hypothetical protein
MRLPWKRKSRNPLFADEFWATDPLDVNTAIAKGGATHYALRHMSDAAIVISIDALVIERDFKADVDFYQRELLRREQARTNTRLMWLAILATIAAVVQGSEAAWSIIDRLR